MLTLFLWLAASHVDAVLIVHFPVVHQPSLQDKQGQCAAVHAAMCGQLDSLAFLLQLEWRPHQGEPSRHDATLQCMASAAATGNKHVSVGQGVNSLSFSGLFRVKGELN